MIVTRGATAALATANVNENVDAGAAHQGAGAANLNVPVDPAVPQLLQIMTWYIGSSGRDQRKDHIVCSMHAAIEFGLGCYQMSKCCVHFCAWMIYSEQEACKYQLSLNEGIAKEKKQTLVHIFGTPHERRMQARLSSC